MVHKVTSRSERTKRQNMLICHDPDKFIFHNLLFLFQVSIFKGCVNQKYCVYYLAYSEFTEIVRNVVY